MPPDDRTPDENYCLLVYIPKNTNYLMNFFTVLDNFGKWNSWLREGDNEEKDVADRWKVSNQMTHDAWTAGENCEDCMSLLLRVKPGFPYISQSSSDGGVTWVDFLIQPHWESGVIAPPVTSEDEANNNAGAILRYLWEWVVQQINDGLTAGQPKSTVVNNVLGQLAPYAAGAALSTAVGSAYDSLQAMSGGDRADWEDDCNYGGIYDAIREFIESNPYSWLDGLSSWLLDTLDDWSGTLIETLNSAAAAMGGAALWNFVANQGGGGGGAGFGTSCVREYFWRFDGADSPYTSDHCFVTNEGISGTNCLKSDPGHWSNGVNYSNGVEFWAEFLQAGTVTLMEGQQRCTTFAGTTGVITRIEDEVGGIVWTDSGSTTADNAYHAFGVGGLSVAVLAGYKIYFAVINSDNVGSNLDSDQHRLDNVHVTGVGIRF